MKNRYLGLDILRTVAISMVVFVHSIGILSPSISQGLFGYVIGKIIAITFLFGAFGVEIFFALSGFLIGKTLIVYIEIQPKYGIKNTLSFWQKRWLRTLPLYLVVLLVNSLSFDIYDYNYLFFIQNFTSVITNVFFLESWSLAVEEWSYILLPLLILLFHKFYKLKTSIKLAIILLIISSWLVRIHYMINNSFDLRTIVITRLDAITYGVLIAYLIHFKNRFIIKNKKKIFFISLSSLFVLYIILRMGPAPFNLHQKFILFKFLDTLLGLPLINILTALLIPYLIDCNFTSLNNKLKNIITYLSKISYSLYLWHFSFLYIFIYKDSLNIKSDNILVLLTLFFAYISISIIFSHLSYKIIEKPFLRLKDKIEY
jgi:peptidoglycan/LPS O-acetylase OafA/YrhL